MHSPRQNLVPQPQAAGPARGGRAAPHRRRGAGAVPRAEGQAECEAAGGNHSSPPSGKPFFPHSANEAVVPITNVKCSVGDSGRQNIAKEEQFSEKDRISV